MRLFHVSSERLSRLEPRVGGARHAGEDPRARNQPVVWLASEPTATIREGKVPEYLHEVEVPEDDPHLYVDEPFEATMKAYRRMFPSEPALRWYFLTRGVDVVAVSTWSSERQRYE